MNWEKIYTSKVVDAETAVAGIKSGDRVYLGGGSGTPSVLVEALTARADTLKGVEITHVMTFSPAPYVAPEFAGSFRHNAMFIGGNVRGAIHEGRADFTPVFLSEIPGLFRDGILPLDYALVTLSPPDEHGFCSFGVEVGTTKPAAESARVIVAQINRQMPRTLGNSFIHVSRLHHIVESDSEIPEVPQGEYSATNEEVGKKVAELIPDGATLQMGIGAIPDAVLHNLGSHRDLGVHTELFSDGVVDLVEAGIINCAQKSFHPGKIVSGFMLGSRKLYDFSHNNPMIEMHPTDYVNDPFNIARNDKMVAINSAVQVDLTGQVAADSIGHRFYSGVGGQIDFIRGAARSKGGVPIIALPSAAKGNSVSRIVPSLYEGAGVTTTRNDVHYIVTEFGAAQLYGRTVRQRAKALIEVSHPEFREELTRQARDLGYL